MSKSSFPDFSARHFNRSNRAASLQAFETRNRFSDDIGTLRSRFRASGEVNKDASDTYTFRLRRSATVNLSLENEENLGFFDLFGTKKRVQAKLLSQGNTLESTNRVAPEDEDSFRIRLSAGTYSVKLTGRSEKDVEYDLELRLGSREEDDDDDDDD